MAFQRRGCTNEPAPNRELVREHTASGKDPRWDTSIVGSWWRNAGHLARLADREPGRYISPLVSWRDAACRRTVRGQLWRQSDRQGSVWTEAIARPQQSVGASRARRLAMPTPRGSAPGKRSLRTSTNGGGWRTHSSADACIANTGRVMQRLIHDRQYAVNAPSVRGRCTRTAGRVALRFTSSHLLARSYRHVRMNTTIWRGRPCEFPASMRLIRLSYRFRGGSPSTLCRIAFAPTHLSHDECEHHLALAPGSSALDSGI